MMKKRKQKREKGEEEERGFAGLHRKSLWRKKWLPCAEGRKFRKRRTKEEAKSKRGEERLVCSIRILWGSREKKDGIWEQRGTWEEVTLVRN